ncbi:MAG: RNA polymerase sigma factor [Patescibacteria group bacterium]
MTNKQETKLKAIFDVAHHDYEKGMNGYAFFKTNDHQIGENLVQDTFMKTWAYLVKKGKIEMMKTFLYHVLNNLIIDQYRKHKTTSLDAMTEKGFDPVAEDHKRIFNILDGKSAILLITKLPLIYQKVVRMRYVQNLSLKEMSLLTGQSKNTVAVQAHRGLEKLKLLYSHA